MNIRAQVAAAAVGVCLLAGGGWGMTLLHDRTVQQPLHFSHRDHLKEEMACVDCHKGVKTGRYATLAPVRACMLCHKKSKGEHPDEPKVRTYAKEGRAIPWVRVNRLPGHVYFSHVVHVRLARMKCKVCHGDMKDRVQPVTVSQIGGLDMAACIDCHRAKGASVDCIRCHQ